MPKIELNINDNRLDLLIDDHPCLSTEAPFQFEWLCQALLWHLERRGYEGTAVLFRAPFEESPYGKVEMKRMYSKPPSQLKLEDIGL